MERVKDEFPTMKSLDKPASSKGTSSKAGDKASAEASGEDDHKSAVTREEALALLKEYNK